MGGIIQNLFKVRLKAKKEGKKALSQTIKLMLNSSYGKTVMKSSNTERVIVNTHQFTKNKETGEWTKKEKTNFNNYVYRYFHSIKSYRKINENQYEFEKCKADFSYNRAQVGCAILSYSKRIMNEVFGVANDNNYTIYYTDTDSLHLDLKNVKPLEKKYKEIYGKELNGKQLGQFHTDFDLKGAKGEIYATQSIFLGKKCYLDCLESVDEKGNTITGHHIRLKGITTEGIEHSSKKYEEGYLGLFKHLAAGKSEKILLNPYNEDTGKQKVLFEFKDGKVKTRTPFYREVKF